MFPFQHNIFMYSTRAAREPLDLGLAQKQRLVTELEERAMADVISIRPLTKADKSDWLPLWKGYQEFYRVDIAEAVSNVTWQRLLDPDEPVDGALAWQGESAIGLVHHIRHRSTWTIADYCYLQDLFVLPDVRGKGVGRKLIEHVYEMAEAAGCARVYWNTHETNSNAMLLYDRIAEKSGFVQYRRGLR
jgi:GNAT superfamily N-acetyltransferase